MKWLLLATLLPSAAFAGNLEWGTVTGSRFRADYVAPATMRLRVFSPQGGTVEIRSHNKVVAKGTIPFEYRPKEEGFISVTVTLPDGRRWWGNSVRMKAKTECQLWVLGPPGSEGPTVATPVSSPSSTVPASTPPPGDDIQAPVDRPGDGAIEPPGSRAAPGGARPRRPRTGAP